MWPLPLPGERTVRILKKSKEITGDTNPTSSTKEKSQQRPEFAEKKRRKQSAPVCQPTRQKKESFGKSGKKQEPSEGEREPIQARARIVKGDEQNFASRRGVQWRKDEENWA